MRTPTRWLPRWLPKKPTALIVPALLLLGCTHSLQMIPVEGNAAEIDRFEGRWFDEEGQLIAVVPRGSTPRLGLRLPNQFRLRDARVQEGRLIFHLQTDWSVPTIQGSLTLGGGKAVLGEMLPPEARKLSYSCGSAMTIPSIVLVRNPSRLWLAKLSFRDASRLMTTSYRRAHDAVFDRLSRIL